jgi:hypothetical protein
MAKRNPASPFQPHRAFNIQLITLCAATLLSAVDFIVGDPKFYDMQLPVAFLVVLGKCVAVPAVILVLLTSVVFGVANYRQISGGYRTATIAMIVLACIQLPDLSLRRLTHLYHGQPHSAEREALVQQALELRRSKQFPEAERVYNNILDKESSGYFTNDPYPWSDTELLLADTLEDQFKFEEAIETYNRDVRRIENSFGAFDVRIITPLEKLGDMCAVERKYNQSKDAYERALAVNEFVIRRYKNMFNPDSYLEGDRKRLRKKLDDVSEKIQANKFN